MRIIYRFLGYVSDETLSNCMNACDIACVPSRNEPFGIVVLEAWDTAKPVIATDAIYLIDKFSNGILGYKNPGVHRMVRQLLDGRSRSNKEDGAKWQETD